MQNADMLKGAVRLVAQLDENFPEIINADEIYAIKLDDDTGFIMIYPESDNNSFIYTVEYMCRYCGLKQSRRSNLGRPMPGSCPRRPKVGGKTLPHVWVINRKY